MIKIKYTKESFEEVLQQAYDDLQPEDIINLICEVVELLKVPENYNEFIHSVSKNVWNKRNISFKQWKALSAYADGIKKNKNKKSF